jgi:predicted enzyme related to lactoylglutathione lyase
VPFLCPKKNLCFGSSNRLGGFFSKEPEWSPHYPAAFITVDDTRSDKEVADAGGKILSEPTEIPASGNMFIYRHRRQSCKHVAAIHEIVA